MAPIKIKRKSRQFTIINDNHKHFTPPNTITNLLVIPKQLINKILISYRELPINGHTGMSRTIHKIQNNYYWPTLSKDTTELIKSRHKCQENKKLIGKSLGQLQPISISNWTD